MLTEGEIASLIYGHERNGRVRWRYRKGDVYGFLKDIHDPKIGSWLTNFVAELCSLIPIEDFMTKQGKAYFSTYEGKAELKELKAFLSRYGDMRWLPTLQEQKNHEETDFRVELATVRERMHRGEDFSVEDFITRYPHLRQDPLALWPNINDKPANLRAVNKIFVFFDGHSRSRFGYFPVFLRAMQYADKSTIDLLFKNKKDLPTKGEMISALWETLVQICRAEIHPNCLELVAFVSKRCALQNLVHPFRDTGAVGDEDRTLADAWYSLAQEFYIDPAQPTDNNDEAATYSREVMAMAQDVLAAFTNVRPLR